MRIIQAWGMTETSPLASVAPPAAHGVEGDEHWTYRATAGRPLAGRRGAHRRRRRQPAAVGRRDDRRARGARPVGRRAPTTRTPSAPEKFHDGWLRTGDIASIDDDGFIRITDRAKDVIKSGGEWISLGRAREAS